MKIRSDSFAHGAPIPATYAFGKKDPVAHFALAANRNPHLAWSEVPAGTCSFVLICNDPDVPTVPETVNREDRTVPHDQPRCDFCHWVMVDIPPDTSTLAEAAASDGVTAGGKKSPPGPTGSRQGLNDYTGWFAGDAAMAGDYHGYDGPAPPWNDERVHHYHFRLLALDIERCPVEGDRFTAAEVARAVSGHVLGEAEIVGTYTLNPAVG